MHANVGRVGKHTIKRRAAERGRNKGENGIILTCERIYLFVCLLTLEIISLQQTGSTTKKGNRGVNRSRQQIYYHGDYQAVTEGRDWSQKYSYSWHKWRFGKSNFKTLSQFSMTNHIAHSNDEDREVHTCYTCITWALPWNLLLR